MNYRWGAYNEKKLKYNTGIWHAYRNERKNYYNKEHKHSDWNKVEGTIT